MLENYIGNSVLSFHLGFLLTIHVETLFFCSVTSESAGGLCVFCTAVLCLIDVPHKKCVCASIGIFSTYSCMSGCTCLFTFPMQIPKASLCTESKSRKSYALVGFPELTILTCRQQEGTACCDFLLQAFMNQLFLWHSYIDF